MGAALEEARQQFNMDAIAFGDLFLEDIRQYREDRMKDTGLELLFPIWGIPTDQLAQQMIDGGLQARITCVDPRKVPNDFAGRAFDQALINDLPEGIDPCGENGEFHSFTWAGPMFQKDIRVQLGEVVERDGFVYADVLPEAV
jgi:diphthamide synthase (EF-2-diphthine--ammonia ligase)